MIEPELGGWGGSPTSDGNPGQFSALHGETYNCPAEVAEARYGVTVDYLSFHDEDGGAGFHPLRVPPRVLVAGLVAGGAARVCGLTIASSPTTLRQAQDTAPG